MATDPVGPNGPDHPENHGETRSPKYLSELDVLAHVIGKHIVDQLEYSCHDSGPENEARAALHNLPRLDNSDDLWHRMATLVLDDYATRLKRSRSAEGTRLRQATIRVVTRQAVDVAYRAAPDNSQHSLMNRFADKVTSNGAVLLAAVDDREFTGLEPPTWGDCNRLALYEVSWPTDEQIRLADIRAVVENSEQCNFAAALYYLAEDIVRLQPGVYLTFVNNDWCHALTINDRAGSRTVYSRFAADHVQLTDLMPSLKSVTLPTFVLAPDPTSAP